MDRNKRLGRSQRDEVYMPHGLGRGQVCNGRDACKTVNVSCRETAGVDALAFAPHVGVAINIRSASMTGRTFDSALGVGSAHVEQLHPRTQIQTTDWMCNAFTTLVLCACRPTTLYRVKSTVCQVG